MFLGYFNNLYRGPSALKTILSDNAKKKFGAENSSNRIA